MVVMKDLDKLTKVELQDLLRKAGLPVSGNKPDLIERLKKADAKKSPAAKKSARKSAARKSAARKSPARKSTARKSSARKSAARKSVSRKSPTARKSASRKSPARKTAARKSATRKSVPATSTHGKLKLVEHPVSGVIYIESLMAAWDSIDGSVYGIVEKESGKVRPLTEGLKTLLTKMGLKIFGTFNKSPKKSSPRKSPVSRKSSARKSAARKSPKECPPGKVRNPKTGRCINDPALKKSPAARKSPVAKKSAARKSPAECPPGKVRNPITGRCVNDPSLNGKQTHMYPGTQQIEEQYTMKNGKRHGTYRAFYRSGGVEEAGSYTHGNKTGDWYGIYENDNLKYDGYYNKQGEKDGKWVHFPNEDRPGMYENERERREEIWKNGVKIYEYTHRPQSRQGYGGGGYGGGGGVTRHNEMCEGCVENLISKGIYPHSTDKRLSADDKKVLLKNFRVWAIKNHPDKGGSTKIFAEVSGCVDEFVKTTKCD